MEFDPSNGKLVDGGSISLTVPADRGLSIDLSKTTQLATGFTVQTAKPNGNAPGLAIGFQIISPNRLSPAIMPDHTAMRR